jgi:hypothetical protein
MKTPIQQKQPRSYQEYLKELESLLKRNTGQGMFVGQDVSSNTPMYLPGRVSNPLGTSDSAFNASAYTPPQSLLPEEVQFEQPPDEQPQEEYTSVNDFIDFLGQTTGYSSPSQEQMEAISQQTGVPYVVERSNGISTFNNGERMDDQTGAITTQDGRVSYPNSSYPGGGVGYDDGTVRYFDPLMTGITGFTSQIFGIPLDVTQAYGEINPIEPTPGNVNIGTDLRTKNLTNKSFSLPVDSRVIQIYRADGNPYGNSVLVELPTGERVRLSHLSHLGNFEEGQTLLAGQYVGTTGATGNVTGEHLDVEYYGQDGQLKDLKEFSGFTQPEVLMSSKLEQTQQPEQPMTMQSMQSQEQVPQQPQFAERSAGETASILAKNAGLEPMSPSRKTIGSMFNQAGKVASQAGIGLSIGNSPEGFLGVGETLAGDKTGASAELGQTIAREGLKRNLPEMNLSESASNPSKPGILGSLRQVAGQTLENISDAIPEELNKRFITPITGNALSELVAGGNTKDTTSAYASENGVSRPLNDVNVFETDAYKNSVFGKAGEGINKLKSDAISSLGSIFKPSTPTVKRVVGDVSGVSSNPGQASSLMDSAPSMSQMVSKIDNRDPFFKNGSVDLYSKFLNPGASSERALSLDLFKPDFYEDADKIKSVFGGTFLQSGANDRYKAIQDKKEEERRQAEASKPRESLQDYLNKGKTEAQWYAETGQQSTLDQMGKVENRPQNQPQASSQPQYFSSNGTLNQSARDLIKTIPNGVGPKNPNPSNLPLFQAPVSAPSATLKPQAQQPSLIERLLGNIFRR